MINHFDRLVKLESVINAAKFGGSQSNGNSHSPLVEGHLRVVSLKNILCLPSSCRAEKLLGTHTRSHAVLKSPVLKGKHGKQGD